MQKYATWVVISDTGGLLSRLQKDLFAIEICHDECKFWKKIETFLKILFYCFYFFYFF